MTSFIKSYFYVIVVESIKLKTQSEHLEAKRLTVTFNWKGSIRMNMMLRVICDEHNHPPAQHMEAHPFSGRLYVDETHLLADLTRKNTTPRNILSTLKKQNKNNSLVIKTAYNAQQNIRMDAQAGRTPMQVLLSHLHTDNYVYDFTTGLLNYIEDKWLKKYKQMFVSVWIDQHLNFGNHTTNKVDSQHARLKRYLESANSKLDRFVERINEIVQSQVSSINLSFENSLIYQYNQHNLKCFVDLRGKVSNEAIAIILGEIQKLNGLTLDSSNCGCQVHNSCGLRCACMLSVYLNSG
ncbi:hypothetical protein LXL04_034361 [Taraxacum kok-saghyz]